MVKALFESDLASVPLLQKGKVRDIYAVDNDHLLIVTTDRISAFDVVFSEPIPGKGAVLTEVAEFWFERLQHIVPNHVSSMTLSEVLTPDEIAQVEGRAVIVKKLTPLPIEAIVRGYLIGSGWKDYQGTGTVCGIRLPRGLPQAGQLPEPIFTPSTKAALGDHDENIDFDRAAALIGQERAAQLRDISIRIYQHAAEFVAGKGIIIADTKFEFGLNADEQLVLIDEVLTPDSSRFWPASEYTTGISPPSFDKQFVRDYLETLDWDKTPPPPPLPLEIIEKTAEKYREAARRLRS
ncbi:MAG: phosphoribosylaminoimidazolesuccinocarboxamide synthase [Pseudomonadota bacterium]